MTECGSRQSGCSAVPAETASRRAGRSPAVPVDQPHLRHAERADDDDLPVIVAAIRRRSTRQAGIGRLHDDDLACGGAGQQTFHCSTSEPGRTTASAGPLPTGIPSAVAARAGESPSQQTARLAPDDIELGGKQIRKRQAVIAVMAAGNRDPKRFPGSRTVSTSAARTIAISPSAGPPTTASARPSPGMEGQVLSTRFSADCPTCASIPRNTSGARTSDCEVSPPSKFLVCRRKNHRSHQRRAPYIAPSPQARRVARFHGYHRRTDTLREDPGSRYPVT